MLLQPRHYAIPMKLVAAGQPVYLLFVSPLTEFLEAYLTLFLLLVVRHFNWSHILNESFRSGDAVRLVEGALKRLLEDLLEDAVFKVCRAKKGCPWVES